MITFKSCSLSMVFRNVTVMCLLVIFFVFILLVELLVSIGSLNQFWKILGHYLFKYSSLLEFSSLRSLNPHHTDVFRMTGFVAYLPCFGY